MLIVFSGQVWGKVWPVWICWGLIWNWVLTTWRQEQSSFFSFRRRPQWPQRGMNLLTITQCPHSSLSFSLLWSRTLLKSQIFWGSIFKSTFFTEITWVTPEALISNNSKNIRKKEKKKEKKTFCNFIWIRTCFSCRWYTFSSKWLKEKTFTIRGRRRLAVPKMLPAVVATQLL